MTTSLIEHVRKAALSILTNGATGTTPVLDAHAIANAVQESVVAELGTFQLISYVEPVELEGYLGGDDGIGEGCSRLVMVEAVVTSMTGEDVYQYRGQTISVRVGHERVAVLVAGAAWAYDSAIEGRSMSLPAALRIMRDLDQLIDYLRAESA